MARCLRPSSSDIVPSCRVPPKSAAPCSGVRKAGHPHIERKTIATPGGHAPRQAVASLLCLSWIVLAYPVRGLRSFVATAAPEKCSATHEAREKEPEGWEAWR